MRTEWMKRGALVIPVALFATVGDAEAQRYDACYTEKTGVIYMIDPSGLKPGNLPTECTKPDKHIQFDWVDADSADHSGLLGLENDDHPQYLLADGTRAMSGNLGIGTTAAPTSPLTIKPVNGSEIEFATGTGNNAEIHARNMMRVGTLNTQPVSLITDAFDRLFVAGNGNVGIGTTTPGEKLSVDGVVETTGGVKFNDGTVQTTAAAASSSPWAGYEIVTESLSTVVRAGRVTTLSNQAWCPVGKVPISGGYHVDIGPTTLKLIERGSRPLDGSPRDAWTVQLAAENPESFDANVSLTVTAICVDAP